VVLAVGDVAGHGIGSAITMIETRASLRLLLDGTDDLTAIARALHRHLYHREGGPSRYVTLFLGDLDPAGRTFHWVGAGHDAHLFRADGSYHNLDSTGSPLALVDPLMLDESPPPVQLGTGDVLVVLTDGLNEAACPNGTQYSTARLLDAVRRSAHHPAADITERAFTEVDGHLGGCRQEDDMTMVVVKVG
jgi:sigma-B regulation protein RsbU (phosphoserine phosphatase)